MCLLTFFPGGVLPDVTALANGTYANEDGHGFAIVTGRRIIVRHGMNADTMIASFDRMRRRYPHGPALFHSRFGTHGTIGRANCHPFRLGDGSRTVLAHNGILPKSVQPRTGDTRSDTRIAADDFLSHDPFGPLCTRAARKRLTRWLGHANKIVILTVDPRYRSNAYIVNERRGIWDHGIWYSNDGYREPTFGWDVRGLAGTYRCPACHVSGVLDLETGFCTACGICVDCGEPAEYCFCYVPAKALA